MSNVLPTTMTAFNEITNSMVPKQVYGTMHSASFYKLTSEVMDVICEHAPLQPNNPEIMFGIHELRAEAPKPSGSSVFNAHFPHFAYEIIPMVSSKGSMDDALEWGRRFHEALLKTDPANVCPAVYVSFIPSKEMDVKAIFGRKYEPLRLAKKQFDPHNRFNTALVQP